MYIYIYWWNRESCATFLPPIVPRPKCCEHFCKNVANILAGNISCSGNFPRQVASVSTLDLKDYFRSYQLEI